MLGYVGNSGYSWSSAVGGTKGMHLDFGMTWLPLSGSSLRAHGFPLRCLSE
ncbi:hypothetical protein [uncultured Rikenella sp.]|uniref:hypothetical protein n=1 Tax=uncultured Rikenella sp. TaxID=368003 RepID=UPI0026188314|nr:hypothetical protein [uncultured Rikenella sp.]